MSEVRNLTSQPYTKREMDVFLRNIDNKTTEILEQVRMTNGRVSRLELWKARIVGALAFVTFLLAVIIVPIVVKTAN